MWIELQERFMKCVIGSSGELKKEFDVASPGLCRVNAALAITADGADMVDFRTIGENGAIDPNGSGTAEKTAPSADGSPCAQVTLQNGRSGNICTAPSR